MLNRDTPLAVAPHCYINHLHIDSWRYSLFAMINTAAQQFAKVVYDDYQHSPDIEHYRIFTGLDNGVWVLGVATHLPNSVREGYSAVMLSRRSIEKHHCRDNIALIIANEIGKMPVMFSARHYD